MKITVVNVNGQEMYVCNSKIGDTVMGKNTPHSHYCLKQRAHSHNDKAHFIYAFNVSILAFEHIAKEVGGINKVLEIFGGSGWQSSVIQRINKPKLHVAWDCEPDCLASIKISVPQVTCELMDSYEEIKHIKYNSFNWIHADFKDYTFARQMRGDYGDTLKHMFYGSSKYVTITDSAIYGFSKFEICKEAYRKLLKMDTNNWRDYYYKLSDWYMEHYGFSIVYVSTWHHTCAIYLLKKGGNNKDFPIHEQKDKAIIEILDVIDEEDKLDELYESKGLVHGEV